MKLKELRIKRRLTQPQLAKALQGTEPQIRPADISRYERYVCLPTPEQLQILCQMLEADPEEIYSAEEMDLANCYKIGHPSPGKSVDEKTYYKLTANILIELASGLKTKVATCGYGDITSWTGMKIVELNAEFEAKKEMLPPETEANQEG